MRSMSLLVKNAQVFNVYLKRFRPASVWISGDRFHYIDPAQDLSAGAAEILDAGGRYMIPGLIDIHMHIESSMLSPMAYSRCAAKNGVTTIVSEPHEVANVKGLRGVEAMIAGGEASPIDMYFGIPSSVPSTCEALETTGGTIRMEEMKRLLENPRVVCVGEIMNYRQIIRENSLEITKFLRYLAQARPGFAVEGHCPSLVDRELAEFLYLGIDADHTEHTLEEFRQRIENGMFMELQAKMLLPEILQYIKDEKVFSRCGFVTDDTMADRLVSEGGINAVAAKAVTAGFPLEEAICCATLNNAQRMRLYDRGAIAPGQLADFILLSDPASFRPEMVFKGGRRIYDAAAPQAPAAARTSPFPEDFYRTVQVAPVSAETFRLPAPEGTSRVEARAIEVSPAVTQTKERRVVLPVRDGRIDWRSGDCALAAVLERHGKSGAISFGLVAGCGLHSGAVATTYFHDHHNLFVLGRNPADMAAAVNRLRSLQGGILTVLDGEVTAQLPLPVCGLLSEASAEQVGADLHAVRENLHAMGYTHRAPIMSLCTLGLPVSPALKLTDKGLVDVRAGQLVELITEAGP